MPNSKAYSSKKYKKFHGIASQKIELYKPKYMKNGTQIKNFQSNVKTLVGGSDMFIFISEIGHLSTG